jgi:Transglycosylase SLT domain/Putative peptidoglycan binding domain
MPEIPRLTRTWWLTQPLMRGDEVWQAQLLLNAQQGAGLKPDGIFGKATRDALRIFQERAKLPIDGVLGPVTWAALHGAQRPAAAIVSGFESVFTADTLNLLTTPHRRYPDGVEWALTRQGVVVAGEAMPPSGTEASLAADVLGRYADQIVAASARFPVPAELVVATICTESSGKERALRLEPGCAADPSLTPHRCSMGLMQTLLSTAREALGNDSLTLRDLENPATSIQAGMAYMWRQAISTRFDPPLVAAAYNAGSVRYEGSAPNRWKLRQFPIGTGKHVDRFVRYFNATLAAMGGAAGAAQRIPRPGVSFAALLG